MRDEIKKKKYDSISHRAEKKSEWERQRMRTIYFEMERERNNEKEDRA